jgi:integrase
MIRYYRSPDFKMKGGDDDRKRRRGILEWFRKDFGNDMVADFTFEHIEAILIRKTEKQMNAKGRIVGGQVAAINLRKQLRRVFALAKKLKWISDNPVLEADTVGQRRLNGYRTWEECHILQYQQRHPIGTKARLALEIILWTGQRRGDARLFGPKHIVDGKINYRTGKTGADIWLPVARDLRRAIDAMPAVGMTTYLVTAYGKPYSKDGLGNKIAEWCGQAGLEKEYRAHGLRKAIARRMAQLRATDEEMMAVGGWKDPGQVRVYTEAVGKQALAEGVIGRVDNEYSTGGDS